MKVLLTGAAGQLGKALLRSKPEGVELISTSRNATVRAVTCASSSASSNHVPNQPPPLLPPPPLPAG